MREFPPEEDFLNQTVETEVPFILRRYAQLGLSDRPTYAEVRPHAETSFRRNLYPDAFGLILGRIVDTDDVNKHVIFQGIASNLAAFQISPEEAFDAMIEALITMPEIFGAQENPFRKP